MVADENSVTEELETVKHLLKKTLKRGDIWNVVSSKWYRKWSNFIRLTESSLSHPDGERCNPGPIDNSDILENDRLKTNALESNDYTLICNELFEYLKKKYSVVSDNHILERKVIRLKTARLDNLVVEVFLLRLKFILASSNNQTKIMEVTKELTVAELERKVRALFELPDTEPLRLLIKCNDEFEVIPAEAPVHDQFQMDQEVLVDVKKTGQWCYRVKNGRENGATAAISSGSSLGGNHFSPSSSYDKTSKSSSSYGRGSGITPGLRGLNNLGNTCFMNSAIQSLSNVPTLTDFFRSGKWQKELNPANPLGMDGEIASSYAELIDNLWSGHNTPFMPRRFKMAVGRFAPQFSGFQQQDAQELMAFLLDGLHEDLNRIKKKPYVEVKDSDGRPDEVVANESWESYQKRNDSIIVDLFHGQLRSELICPECKRISVTFDPFCYLSLPMPAEETPVVVTLYRSLSGVESKPMRYSFRAFADISYREFLKRFRAAANLPPDMNLMLGEPVQHSTMAFRVFPPSSELDSSLERQLTSPLPEHPSYRANTSFVAFEVPPQGPGDSLVWVELNQSVNTMTRPLLLHLRRSEISKEEQLVLELCAKLMPYSTASLEDIRNMLKMHPSTKDENLDDDDGSEENAQMESDLEEENQWNNLSEEKKLEVGRRLFSIESRYTGGPKFIDPKSVKLRITLSKAFLETVDHTSVMEMKGHGRGVQLSNCLDLFTKKETLGERDSWYCNKCKKHQRATKKFDLWKLPETLVIHLKRFGNAHRLWRNKLNTKVFFPLKGLNLNTWMKNKFSNMPSYDLVSVVNHFGSMGGGHYTANALNDVDKSWYNFDDSSVSRISSEHVVSQNAYVLVYVRENSSKDDLMDTD